MQLPNWLTRNRLFKMPWLSDDSEAPDAWQDLRDIYQTSDPEKANVISSKFVEGRHELHKVFIDLDVEHWYVPSSTEGHGHLYINVDVTPDELKELMGTLAKLGIVGDGWAYQLSGRGENSFRLPGFTKKERPLMASAKRDGTEPPF